MRTKCRNVGFCSYQMQADIRFRLEIKKEKQRFFFHLVSIHSIQRHQCLKKEKKSIEIKARKHRFGSIPVADD